MTTRTMAASTLMKDNVKKNWVAMKNAIQIILRQLRINLLGQNRFKPCLWPGYFLLQSKDCMFETCMLLAGVHEHL